MKFWMKRILLILGVLALVGILYAAFAPLPYDPVLPEEKWGVYGLYPVRCTDVLMERIEATLMNNAAISFHNRLFHVGKAF